MWPCDDCMDTVRLLAGPLPAGIKQAFRDRVRDASAHTGPQHEEGRSFIQRRRRAVRRFACGVLCCEGICCKFAISPNGSATSECWTASISRSTGERAGLIGPNGCGKTTLLRIVAGETPADRGSVQFTPTSVRMGYLPQALDFATDATVGDILRAATVNTRRPKRGWNVWRTHWLPHRETHWRQHWSNTTAPWPIFRRWAASRWPRMPMRCWPAWIWPMWPRIAW